MAGLSHFGGRGGGLVPGLAYAPLTFVDARSLADVRKYDGYGTFAYSSAAAPRRIQGLALEQL